MNFAKCWRVLVGVVGATLWGAGEVAAAPSIIWVSHPEEGIYNTNYRGWILFTVAFNEPNVTVTGTPTIGVRIGNTNVDVPYVHLRAYTPRTELVFEIPQSGTYEGALTITGPIKLNGGSIKGADGSDASLAFAPVEDTGVVIDLVLPAGPVIQGVNPSSPMASEAFTLYGTAEPGGRVTSSLAPYNSTVVDANGQWFLTFPGREPGTHRLVLYADDAAGNDSHWQRGGPNGVPYDVTVGAGVPPTGRPVVTAQPASRAAAVGETVTFTAGTSAASPSYQWFHNGAVLGGATASSHTVSAVEPARAGLYSATVTESGQTSFTTPAILGVASTAKVLGAGQEFRGNITHPNGNVYDQFLAGGNAVTITADAGQVARLSYVDLSDNIVQVEFSGAGSLTLLLDSASGPATAKNYNQPDVQYMRGHAGIVISGANETTNVSVFSVGRITAVDQSLFRDDVAYDGVANLAFLAILSANGKFGGVFAANASFWSTRGITGIYAPGVKFGGPVYLCDIIAAEEAQPTIILGGSSHENGIIDVRVAGGDLKQANGRAVEVSGFYQLRFANGTDSHGNPLPAKLIAGRLQENGADVTIRAALRP